MARSSISLKAHRYSSEEVDEEGESASSAESLQDEAEIDSQRESDGDTKESEFDDDEQRQETRIERDLPNISFGALVQAQEELNPSKFPNSQTSFGHDAERATDAQKISTLRARLAELKKLKGSANHSEQEIKSKGQSGKQRDSNEPPKRSSKHAPTEQSSRRAVTRKRPVIDVAQDPYHSRDPRFSTASSSSQPSNEAAAKNKYAFLKSYRDDELSKLKSALDAVKARKHRRKSKALTADEEYEVQQLKRQINSIENRIKSETEKERFKDIERRHKKEERERIKQGKKPFYLKRSELKERALKEKFEGMKAKEREKAVERRRKKLSQRERRAMPNERRSRNES